MLDVFFSVILSVMLVWYFFCKNTSRKKSFTKLISKNK